MFQCTNYLLMRPGIVYFREMRADRREMTWMVDYSKGKDAQRGK
jgi:hypothetical protein